MEYASKYIEKQLIGRGHYGIVYLVQDRKTHKLFVAKKIEFLGMTEQQQETALKEVKIHQNLNHKNILQFVEYFLQSSVLIMVMEYCEFGDLSVYIKQRKQSGENFNEALIINLFVQMLFGLNYLHDNKILHRDIKTQNIFIDSEGTIKLADFGISKMLQQTQNLAFTVIGTPYYLSPEACLNTGYNLKSDIWSLGCVLYELCTLQYPFSGDNILTLAKKITSQQPKEIGQKYSRQLGNLIRSMLKKIPEERPTIKQILSLKWIHGYLIEFKMVNSIEINQNTQKSMENRQYPIFETCSNLQNQFIDLQYRKGQVHKIDTTSSNYKKITNKTEDMLISPQKSKSACFRQKCIQKMGLQLFQEIYCLMKTLQSKGASQSHIQSLLKQKYSKKEFESSMDVAQLLYLQEMQSC